MHRVAMDTSCLTQSCYKFNAVTSVSLSFCLSREYHEINIK